jgi:hypothetical protein
MNPMAEQRLLHVEFRWHCSISDKDALQELFLMTLMLLLMMMMMQECVHLMHCCVRVMSGVAERVPARQGMVK